MTNKPLEREKCGNRDDDDCNGKEDYAEPACCPPSGSCTSGAVKCDSGAEQSCNYDKSDACYHWAVTNNCANGCGSDGKCKVVPKTDLAIYSLINNQNETPVSDSEAIINAWILNTGSTAVPSNVSICVQFKVDGNYKDRACSTNGLTAGGDGYLGVKMTLGPGQHKITATLIYDGDTNSENNQASKTWTWKIANNQTCTQDSLCISGYCSKAYQKCANGCDKKECTVGTTGCFDTKYLRSCKGDLKNCGYWADNQTCANSFCYSNSSGTAYCCVPQCTANEKRCVNSYASECIPLDLTSGCLGWSDPVKCPNGCNGNICKPVALKPDLVPISLSVSPSPPIGNQSAALTAKIVNYGQAAVLLTERICVEFFVDSKSVGDSCVKQALAVNASLSFTKNTTQQAGTHIIKASINYVNDANIKNNNISGSFNWISKRKPNGALCSINEECESFYCSMTTGLCADYPNYLECISDSDCVKFDPYLKCSSKKCVYTDSFMNDKMVSPLEFSEKMNRFVDATSRGPASLANYPANLPYSFLEREALSYAVKETLLSIASRTVNNMYVYKKDYEDIYFVYNPKVTVRNADDWSLIKSFDGPDAVIINQSRYYQGFFNTIQRVISVINVAGSQNDILYDCNGTLCFSDNSGDLLQILEDNPNAMVMLEGQAFSTASNLAGDVSYPSSTNVVLQLSEDMLKKSSFYLYYNYDEQYSHKSVFDKLESSTKLVSDLDSMGITKMGTSSHWAHASKLNINLRRAAILNTETAAGNYVPSAGGEYEIGVDTENYVMYDPINNVYFKAPIKRFEALKEVVFGMFLPELSETTSFALRIIWKLVDHTSEYFLNKAIDDALNGPVLAEAEDTVKTTCGMSDENFRSRLDLFADKVYHQYSYCSARWSNGDFSGGCDETEFLQKSQAVLDLYYWGGLGICKGYEPDQWKLEAGASDPVISETSNLSRLYNLYLEMPLRKQCSQVIYYDLFSEKPYVRTDLIRTTPFERLAGGNWYAPTPDALVDLHDHPSIYRPSIDTITKTIVPDAACKNYVLITRYRQESEKGFNRAVKPQLDYGYASVSASVQSDTASLLQFSSEDASFYGVDGDCWGMKENKVGYSFCSYPQPQQKNGKSGSPKTAVKGDYITFVSPKTNSPFEVKISFEDQVPLSGKSGEGCFYHQSFTETNCKASDFFDSDNYENSGMKMCGNGALDGAEVCDGKAGVSETELCNADCLSKSTLTSDGTISSVKAVPARTGNYQLSVAIPADKYVDSMKIDVGTSESSQVFVDTYFSNLTIGAEGGSLEIDGYRINDYLEDAPECQAGCDLKIALEVLQTGNSSSEANSTINVTATVIPDPTLLRPPLEKLDRVVYNESYANVTVEKAYCVLPRKSGFRDILEQNSYSDRLALDTSGYNGPSIIIGNKNTNSRYNSLDASFPSPYEEELGGNLWVGSSDSAGTVDAVKSLAKKIAEAKLGEEPHRSIIYGSDLTKPARIIVGVNASFTELQAAVDLANAINLKNATSHRVEWLYDQTPYPIFGKINYGKQADGMERSFFLFKGEDSSFEYSGGNYTISLTEAQKLEGPVISWFSFTANGENFTLTPDSTYFTSENETFQYYPRDIYPRKAPFVGIGMPYGWQMRAATESPNAFEVSGTPHEVAVVDIVNGERILGWYTAGQYYETNFSEGDSITYGDLNLTIADIDEDGNVWYVLTSADGEPVKVFLWPGEFEEFVFRNGDRNVTITNVDLEGGVENRAIANLVLSKDGSEIFIGGLEKGDKQRAEDGSSIKLLDLYFEEDEPVAASILFSALDQTLLKDASCPTGEKIEINTSLQANWTSLLSQTSGDIIVGASQLGLSRVGDKVFVGGKNESELLLNLNKLREFVSQKRLPFDSQKSLLVIEHPYTGDIEAAFIDLDGWSTQKLYIFNQNVTEGLPVGGNLAGKLNDTGPVWSQCWNAGKLDAADRYAISRRTLVENKTYQIEILGANGGYRAGVTGYVRLADGWIFDNATLKIGSMPGWVKLEAGNTVLTFTRDKNAGSADCACPDGGFTNITIVAKKVDKPAKLSAAFTAIYGTVTQKLYIFGNQTALNAVVSGQLSGKLNDSGPVWSKCANPGKLDSADRFAISRTTLVENQSYQIQIVGANSGLRPGVTGYVRIEEAGWIFDNSTLKIVSMPGWVNISSDGRMLNFTRDVYAGKANCACRDGGQTNITIVVKRDDLRKPAYEYVYEDVEAVFSDLDGWSTQNLYVFSRNVSEGQPARVNLTGTASDNGPNWKECWNAGKLDAADRYAISRRPIVDNETYLIELLGANGGYRAGVTGYVRLLQKDWYFDKDSLKINSMPGWVNLSADNTTLSFTRDKNAGKANCVCSDGGLTNITILAKRKSATIGDKLPQVYVNSSSPLVRMAAASLASQLNSFENRIVERKYNLSVQTFADFSAVVRDNEIPRRYVTEPQVVESEEAAEPQSGSEDETVPQPEHASMPPQETISVPKVAPPAGGGGGGFGAISTESETAPQQETSGGSLAVTGGTGDAKGPVALENVTQGGSSHSTGWIDEPQPVVAVEPVEVAGPAIAETEEAGGLKVDWTYGAWVALIFILSTIFATVYYAYREEF